MRLLVINNRFLGLAQRRLALRNTPGEGEGGGAGAGTGGGGGGGGNGNDDGLAKKNRELLQELKDANAALKEMRGVFGDRKPADVQAILQQHTQAEEERQKKAGEFDKLLEKRVKEATDALRAELEPRAKKGDQYDDLRFQVDIGLAFRDAGGDPTKEEDLIALVKGRRIKIGEKGYEVFDKEGDPTAKSVKDFLATELKAEKPWLYLGSGSNGGGARGGSSTGVAGAGKVSATDTAGFLANVNDIANGKVKVVS